MYILDAGHIFRLAGYDGGESQTLVFMKREGKKFPFNVGSYGGTNCQEVIRALISRCKYLQSQIPCAETESIIGLLETALLLFEVRAARTKERSIDIPSLSLLSSLRTCDICGHLQCECANDTLRQVQSAEQRTTEV